MNRININTKRTLFTFWVHNFQSNALKCTADESRQNSKRARSRYQLTPSTDELQINLSDISVTWPIRAIELHFKLCKCIYN